MAKWLNELLDAIKEKKELPIISDDEIEEMDEDVTSEELGNFEKWIKYTFILMIHLWKMPKCI